MSGFGLGLGMGLGNVQKAMADYFAGIERNRLQDQELRWRQVLRGDQQKELAYQHDAAKANNFLANASPNTDISDQPDMIELIKQMGAGSRLKTAPALQAASAAIPITAAPGAAQTPAPAVKAQDISSQMKTLLAPTFQQQQAVDEIARTEGHRKEDRQFHVDDVNRQEAFTGKENAANRKNQVEIANIRESGEFARIKAAEAKQQKNSTQDIQTLARMVLGNPSLLKENIPAQTKALVLAEIGRSGSPFAGQRQQALQTTLQQTHDALTQLASHPGKNDYVGSWLYQHMPPIAGSQAASFAEKLQQAKALLSVPGMELFQGFGPLSDSDMKIVQATGGALAQTLAPKDFDAEIGRALQAVERQQQRLGQGTPAPMPQGPQSKVTIKSITPIQ